MFWKIPYLRPATATMASMASMAHGPAVPAVLHVVTFVPEGLRCLRRHRIGHLLRILPGRSKIHADSTSGKSGFGDCCDNFSGLEEAETQKLVWDKN